MIIIKVDKAINILLFKNVVFNFDKLPDNITIMMVLKTEYLVHTSKPKISILKIVTKTVITMAGMLPSQIAIEIMGMILKSICKFELIWILKYIKKIDKTELKTHMETLSFLESVLEKLRFFKELFLILYHLLNSYNIIGYIEKSTSDSWTVG